MIRREFIIKSSLVAGGSAMLPFASYRTIVSVNGVGSNVKMSSKGKGALPIPESIDYNLWCGQAPMKPLMREYVLWCKAFYLS